MPNVIQLVYDSSGVWTWVYTLSPVLFLPQRTKLYKGTVQYSGKVIVPLSLFYYYGINLYNDL